MDFTFAQQGIPMSSHHHPVGQHAPQHHAPHSHQQGYAMHPSAGDQDIVIARQQMFESVNRLSQHMRSCADMCDNFIKTVARHNPNTAAIILSQSAGPNSNAITNPFDARDFLALTNGTLASGGGGGGGGASAAQNGTASPGKVKSKRERKKEKKVRDPNAPKRPPSAYLLFQNEVRQDMRKRHPGMPYSEVLGKVSEAWKALTEDQRKVYQDKTTENMATWNQQKKSHEAGHGSVPDGAGSPDDDDASDDDSSSDDDSEESEPNAAAPGQQAQYTHSSLAPALRFGQGPPQQMAPPVSAKKGDRKRKDHDRGAGAAKKDKKKKEKHAYPRPSA